MTMEFVTDDTVKAMTNGTPQDKETFVDNRLRLIVDPKQVKSWEARTAQTGDLEKNMIIMCRYLHRGERLVSPDLPEKKRLEDMNKAEIAQIKDSLAFRAIDEFSMEELQTAIQAFVNQAVSGF